MASRLLGRAHRLHVRAHAARVADDERRALAKVTAAAVDGSIDHMDALLIEASYLETSLDTERIPLF